MEYALEQNLGLSPKDLDLRKNANGKWISDHCFFSLSHSGEIVAVAVSHAPIGVDVERCERERYEMIASHILTENERAEYEAMPSDVKKMQYVMQAWTQKESLFKRADLRAFIPTQYDTVNADVQTWEILIGESAYFLSVAGDPLARLCVKEVTIQ